MSTISTPSGELKQSRTPIIAISVGHGSLHWVTAILFVMVPFMKKEFDWSYTEVTVLWAIFNASSAIANIPSGAAADIFGRRVLLMAVSLALCGGGMMALGLTDSYLMIAVMMGVIGATSMSWHPPAMSYLSIRYPERRGFAVAMHGFGSSVMQAIGPFAAGIMLNKTAAIPALALAMNWRDVAIINGALPPIIAVLIMLGIRRTGKRVEGQDSSAKMKDYWDGIKELLTNKAVLTLFAVSGFRKVAQNGVLIFLPLYFLDILKFDGLAVGSGVSIIMLAGAVMGPIAGILSDKIGRKQIAYFGMWGMNITLLILPFIGNATVFIVGVAFLGFFIYAARPVIQSWVMDLSAVKMHGSVTSMMFLAETALGTFAPIIGGVIADLYGLTSTFFFLAASVFIANILLPFVA